MGACVEGSRRRRCRRRPSESVEGLWQILMRLSTLLLLSVMVAVAVRQHVGGMASEDASSSSDADETSADQQGWSSEDVDHAGDQPAASQAGRPPEHDVQEEDFRAACEAGMTETEITRH